MKYSLILFFLLWATDFSLGAQDPEIKSLSNALEVFPVGEINMVQYARMLSPQDEAVLGLIWYDPQIMGVLRYPGTQRVLSGEAGYRRYLWQGLHLEFQLLSQLHFLHENTSGRDLLAGVATAELRLGYRWDFTLWNLNGFINPQLFSGVYLTDGRPEAFIQADRLRGLHPVYLSPIPMIFLGIRF